MSTFAQLALQLTSFAAQVGTGVVDLTYALRHHTVRDTEDVPNGAKEITLINVTKYDAQLISASFIPETGVAANAASLNAQLLYDDGAGGAPTALSTDWDGTALTSVSGQVSALVVTPATTIPAGSRVYVAITVNAGGDVWDETGFETEYEEV